jgi:hypothetical protein
MQGVYYQIIILMVQVTRLEKELADARAKLHDSHEVLAYLHKCSQTVGHL